jgi:hypothetical protein
MDKTAEWCDKLAELVAQEVVTPPPAENTVNARLTGIDGTGIAALVSKLKQDTKTYDGFALVFQHDTNYQSFEWLQFITRQLVVDNTAKKGNLVVKTNTTSYQLVDSAAEITDYTFASGSKPANWNTCWKVDSKILPNPKPFFSGSVRIRDHSRKEADGYPRRSECHGRQNPAKGYGTRLRRSPGRLGGDAGRTGFPRGNLPRLLLGLPREEGQRQMAHLRPL